MCLDFIDYNQRHIGYSVLCFNMVYCLMIMFKQWQDDFKTNCAI